MREFLLFCAAFVTCILTGSSNLGGPSRRLNRHAGASIQMSYSVQTNNNNDSSSSNAEGTVTPPTRSPHTGRLNVGTWRPSRRGNRRQQTNNRDDTLGPRRHSAYGSRRYRAHGRRNPITPTGRPRGQTNRQRGNNGNRSNRRRPQNNGAHNRLVATGSHSIANRRQNSGIDPFVALQNGGQQSPFQSRQTAYDFLSNGGNSFRARGRRHDERREENARMAQVMCGVFNKQFVPSAIGGRCVDPA